MKYRVVELSNGFYQTQYRIFPFVWVDSCHAASLDLNEQIQFAMPLKKRQSAIIKTVWK